MAIQWMTLIIDFNLSIQPTRKPTISASQNRQQLVAKGLT